MSTKEDNLDTKKEQEQAPQIAFKDFKNSISNDEFLALLSLAKKEYNDLVNVSKSRDKFEKKVSEAIAQIDSQSGQMPPELAKKLVDGLKRKASKDMKKMFLEEITRHKSITDFLNRFQQSDEILPYMDFSSKNKK